MNILQKLIPGTKILKTLFGADRTKILDIYNIILFNDELKKYYPDVFFEGMCAIQNPGYVSIEKNVRIGHTSSIMANHFLPISPFIKIGEGTVLGSYNAIGSANKIIIGKNVLFAPYVHIQDHDHIYQDIHKPIKEQSIISKGPIIIEDDSWIGFGCHILSGVTIGRHSVIGANSVVTKDIPSYSIAVGSPAKIVKKYDFNLEEWANI